MKLVIITALLCVWPLLAFEQDDYAALSNRIVNAIKERIDQQWDDMNIDANQLPSDFDDETEKLVKVMEFAEKLFNESYNQGQNQDDDEEEEDLKPDEHDDESDQKPEEGEKPSGKNGKEGKSGRKKSRKSSKKNSKKLSKLVKHQARKLWISQKACMTMEEKVNHLCSSVFMVKNNPMMAELYSFWHKKTAGRGAWNNCCAAQDDKQRLACFQNNKMNLQKKLCEKNPEKFSNCCELEGELRSQCFDEYRAKKCEKQMIKEEKKSNKLSDDSRKTENSVHVKDSFKYCCDAGKTFSKGESMTFALCSQNFYSWYNNSAQNMNNACVKGFFVCCTGTRDFKENMEEMLASMSIHGNSENPKMEKQQKTKGKPDSKKWSKNRSQKIDLSSCCAAGKSFGGKKGYDPSTCRSPPKSIPKMNWEEPACVSKFEECCSAQVMQVDSTNYEEKIAGNKSNTKKGKQDEVTVKEDETDEKGGKKRPGKPPKIQKSPEGVKYDSHGNPYYIDRMTPPKSEKFEQKDKKY